MSHYDALSSILPMLSTMLLTTFLQKYNVKNASIQATKTYSLSKDSCASRIL